MERTLHLLLGQGGSSSAAILGGTVTEDDVLERRIFRSGPTGMGYSRPGDDKLVATDLVVALAIARLRRAVQLFRRGRLVWDLHWEVPAETVARLAIRLEGDLRATVQWGSTETGSTVRGLHLRFVRRIRAKLGQDERVPSGELLRHRERLSPLGRATARRDLETTVATRALGYDLTDVERSLLAIVWTAKATR